MKKQFAFCVGVLGFVALTLLGQGTGQNFERVPISQFPLASTVQSNALFVIAIPGQNNNSILASPLANGLFQLESNYSTLTNLIAANQTGGTAIQGIYTMAPVIQASATNTYYEDFGQTNRFGQSLIYAMLNATNDVVLLGPTNCTQQGQCLSYDILSSTASFTRIWIPTNTLVHFPTNYGPWIFYPSNKWMVLFLTNGNVFRDSLQSNLFLERQWTVK